MKLSEKHSKTIAHVGLALSTAGVLACLAVCAIAGLGLIYMSAPILVTLVVDMGLLLVAAVMSGVDLADAAARCHSKIVPPDSWLANSAMNAEPPRSHLRLVK